MMDTKAVAVLLCATGLVGCADDDFGTRSQALAHDGFWDPPADLITLADGYDIENVQAGVWVGESGCGGSFLEGTSQLRDWVLEYWPQVSSVGGYSCRKIANSNMMSVHATGRAIDIMIPVDSSKPTNDSADNDLGDPLGNWLLEHAEEIGVQLIIWDNMIWSSGRSPGNRFNVYTNEHKHHDHLHVELNPEAAALGTPWFKGPMGPPDLGPCGEPLGPDGGIVDDTDACFQAYGPAEFWRVVDGEGHGGSLKWTNAWQADDPSNWGRWHINLSEAGSYRVEYNSVAEYAVYDSAQYSVRHAGEEDDVFLDQSAGSDGWQPIGDFEFAAGEDQWVSLFDNAPVEVPADQHIIADAIRLVRLDGDGGNTGGNNVTGGGPGTNNDNGGRPGGTAEDDGPEVIDGKGGCGCMTASQAVDPSAFLLLGLLFTRRRRR